MRILIDFRCDEGHVTERLIENTAKSIACPTCGNTANRQMAAPKPRLDPISGDFPGATMKWVKERESHMRYERKKADNHGSESLWERSGNSPKK